MRLLTTILTIAMLSGCVIAVNTDDWDDGDSWSSRQKSNAAKIERLELGDSEVAIREDFGKPDFHESFIRDSHEYVVLYYRSRHIESDGVTTKAETTPLLFRSGRLVGWGDAALTSVNAE